MLVASEPRAARLAPKHGAEPSGAGCDELIGPARWQLMQPPHPVSYVLARPSS